MAAVHPILLTVLGGYLGAGKTTLLNEILMQGVAPGQGASPRQGATPRQGAAPRLGVVVNDFGGINIDARLVEGGAGGMVTLANGCICCSISAGFAEALSALAARSPPPEHVIIEASGVADPVRVGHFASLPPYRLDGVVVVADAETISDRVRDRYVGGAVLRQLRGAGLIVLNKTDLVGEPELAALRAWLGEKVPGARIFSTSHGRVPRAVLLGSHTGAGPSPGETTGHDPAHDHGEDYASASLDSETPMREAALRAAIAAWPENVLRAKGIVHLADDPLHRYVLQCVGRRWSLTQDRLWRSDRPKTELVLIGLARRFDGETLLARLRAAEAGA